MRKLPSLALFALVACNTTHNDVTPSRKVILDWDYTKATRVGFAKAAVGARTAKDFVATVATKDAPPFSLDVHVEVAPVEFGNPGERVHHTAAVAIKVTVKDNTGWDLSAKCDEGPNYQIGPVDATGRMQTPLAMIEDCAISEHRLAGTVFKSSWKIGFTLKVYGDGKVEAFPKDGVTLAPK